MSAAKIFTELDMNAQKITNLADGVNPQDAATVAQIVGGGGLTAVTSNDGSIGVTPSGTTVDLSLAAAVSTAGFSLDDASAGGDGIALASDNGSIALNAASIISAQSTDSFIFLEADTSSVSLISGDTQVVVLGTAGGGPVVQVQVGPGGSLTVLDSGANPIFRVNEDGSLQGKTGQSLVFDL